MDGSLNVGLPCRCRRAGDETIVVRNSSIGGDIVKAVSVGNSRTDDAEGFKTGIERPISITIDSTEAQR